MTTEDKRPIVIYHAGCLDGLAAAYAADFSMYRDYYCFYPGVYNEPPPDVTGRSVYLVDFSYSFDVIKDMCSKAIFVHILDHHEQARNNIITEINKLNSSSITKAIKNLRYTYDSEKSGCAIAWWFFMVGNEMPSFMKMIEDQDLWRFNIQETKAFITGLIATGIMSWKLEDIFNYFDSLSKINIGQDIISELCQNGYVILENKRKEAEAMIESSMLFKKINDLLVPVINAPYAYVGNLSDALVESHPFIVVYSDEKDKKRISFRSQNFTGVNVDEIARQYGGGGHRHAAGIRLSLDHPFSLFLSGNNDE